MGRLGHTLFMSAALAALILFSTSEGVSAPKRNPAASTSNTINVGGVNYVDSRVVLAKFGFKATWTERGRKLRLQSGKSIIDIEADKRDVVLNGYRVLMGEPAVFRGTTLYISRIDADKLFMPILSPSSVASPAVPALKVIVIDPGHGGVDTGTQNKGLKLNEKTYTLDVANRLRALLVKQGYKVIMTRTDDRFIPLPQRADIANKAGADLFISIHFNAAPAAPEVRGSETYVMTPQYQRSTGSPKRDSSDNVANPGNRMDPWNALLGYHMHEEVVNRLGSVDRGFKRARFAVLRLVNAPGVLIESGYLSNDPEGRKISTPAYRAEIAQALADGVRSYALAITTAKRN